VPNTPVMDAAQQRILRALFLATADGAPLAHSFRMKHEKDRKVISSLVGKYIKHQFDRYYLTLAGLYACDLEPVRFYLATFNQALPILKSFYKRDAGKNWSMEEITEVMDRMAPVDVQEVQRAISYVLPDLHVVCGYNEDRERGLIKDVQFSEDVLDLEPLPMTRDVEPEPAPAPSYLADFVPANGTPPLRAVDLAALHPAVVKSSSKLAADGHLRQAIHDAFIALDQAVKEKSGIDALGDRLMNEAFTKNKPVLRLSQNDEEQEGFMHLYKGAIKAVRNRYSHDLVEPGSPEEAAEWLAFASVLFRCLDAAERVVSLESTT
jgi:uncharacterized protein (TIGR02391 family)